MMHFVRTFLIYARLHQARSGSLNFGRRMQFGIRLNVRYGIYKNCRRLDAEKGVSKPFENVSCLRRIKSFFKKSAPNFDIFSSGVFSGRIN